MDLHGHPQYRRKTTRRGLSVGKVILGPRLGARSPILGGCVSSSLLSTGGGCSCWLLLPPAGWRTEE